MTEQANIRTGQHVIFHAPDTTVHDALVTAVHSDKCINLIFVPVAGTTQKDANGVKPVPMTSILHESKAGPGSVCCWWKPGIATKTEQTELDDTGQAETEEPTGDDEAAETEEPTGDDEAAVGESETSEPGQQ